MSAITGERREARHGETVCGQGGAQHVLVGPGGPRWVRRLRPRHPRGWGVRGSARREDGDEDLLTKKDWVAVGGGPAHLHVNHEHGMAYVDSYGAGTWSAVTLDQEGKMVRERREVFGEGCRNNTSHPHHTLTLASHVWVVEPLSPLLPSPAGCDSIYHYNKTEAGLQRLETVKAGVGRGPRHMLLLPERSLILVVCELENFLQVSLPRDCTVMYPCCRSTASTTRLGNSSSRRRSNWSAWTTTPGPRSSSTPTGSGSTSAVEGSALCLSSSSWTMTTFWRRFRSLGMGTIISI